MIYHIGTGCQPENDEAWNIEWQFATTGSVAEGKCPGLSKSSGNIMNLILKCIHITKLLFSLTFQD